MLELLFWLLVGHVLCDYPLQGQFLSEAKNKFTKVGEHIWGWCLASHALIHGGAVALITGSFVLGLAEVVAHAGIDYLKCKGEISFNDDQILHIFCKVVWIIILFMM